MSSDGLKNNAGRLSTRDLKAEALRLGFSYCGVAKAEPVDERHMQHFERWLQRGCHADMHYLENHIDLRRDPRLLLPGARTVVSLAMSYNPGNNPTQPAIAWYAQGRDYHEVIRERLARNFKSLPITGEGFRERVFIDTAPIMEKYWAWRCGIGWIGRHTQLVVPGEGSAFFLAEILLTCEADHYDQPHAGHCGSCRRCIEACPTQALSDEGLDARRCLSYLTIEHRGPLPKGTGRHLHECFYGCDRCLRACPHFRPVATSVPDFRPSPQLLSMTPTDWQQLTVDRYRDLFRGSAVKRAKYEGLMRNINSQSLAEDNGNK